MADTAYCYNCKKDIAAGNFLLHSTHCQRNIQICQQCNEPVPRKEIEAHMKVKHAGVYCTKCLLRMEQWQLESHDLVCVKRLIECDYCDLSCIFEEMDKHKAYCSARTELCPDCKKYIQFKDMKKHEFDCEKNHSNRVKLQSSPSSESKNSPFRLKNQERSVHDRGTLSSRFSNVLPVSSAAAKREFSQTSETVYRPNLAAANSPFRLKNQEMSVHDIGALSSKFSNVLSVSPAASKKELSQTNETDTDNSNLFKPIKNYREFPTERIGEDGKFHSFRVDEKLSKLANSRGDSRDDADHGMEKCDMCHSSVAKYYMKAHVQSCSMYRSPCCVCSELISNDERFDHVKKCVEKRNRREDFMNKEDKSQMLKSERKKHRKRSADNPTNFGVEPWTSQAAYYREPVKLFEPVMLPCEFCNDLIPDYELILHQTGCRPDLVKIDENSIKRTKSQASQDQVVENRKSNDAGIPSYRPNPKQPTNQGIRFPITETGLEHQPFLYSSSFPRHSIPMDSHIRPSRGRGCYRMKSSSVMPGDFLTSSLENCNMYGSPLLQNRNESQVTNFQFSDVDAEQSANRIYKFQGNNTIQGEQKPPFCVMEQIKENWEKDQLNERIQGEKSTNSAAASDTSKDFTISDAYQFEDEKKTPSDYLENLYSDEKYDDKIHMKCDNKYRFPVSSSENSQMVEAGNVMGGDSEIEHLQQINDNENKNTGQGINCDEMKCMQMPSNTNMTTHDSSHCTGARCKIPKLRIPFVVDEHSGTVSITNKTKRKSKRGEK